MKLQILLSLLLASSVGFAQTETTETSNNNTASVSDVQKTDEKKGDIDEEITNARMRATLGSKSKWSFKTSFGYNGGSVEKPFDSIRPAYRNAADMQALTALSGSIGGNYRVSKGGNISFGTSLVVRAPLEGDVFSDFNDPRDGSGGEKINRFEMSSPYIDYSHGYRLWGMQMISSATYTHYTTNDSTSSNYYNLIGNVAISQVFLADLGDSSWQAGASISIDKDFFNGDMGAGFLAKGIKRYEYGYGLYPFAEYIFNDTFSFRTVFGYFQFIKYEQDAEAFQYEPYQSVGIGISLSRDIYLYPNVQFTPKDMRADRTNVAISANVNIF